MPSIPSLSDDQETVPEGIDEPAPDFDDITPSTSAGVGSMSVDPALLGAGVTGAAVGGVLADAALTAAGVGLTGELLTDAAAVGAVVLGTGAAYAATRPDEAGRAARFVGGAVANTTGAYAELAAVSAELAVLEQQQKALAAIDGKVAEAKALPGEIKETVTTTVTETVETVKAAPQKTVDTITSRIKSTLDGIQSEAQSQLDAARAEIDKVSPKN